MGSAAAARARLAIAGDRRRILTRLLHGAPSPIALQLARLRGQADAYRAQAIALNAKLLVAAGDWQLVREQLLVSSAQIDRAVRLLVETTPRRRRR